eukprot:1142006-Pelagomonas_calceolata.AAC.2
MQGTSSTRKSLLETSIKAKEQSKKFVKNLVGKAKAAKRKARYGEPHIAWTPYLATGYGVGTGVLKNTQGGREKLVVNHTAHGYAYSRHCSLMCACRLS